MLTNKQIDNRIIKLIELKIQKKELEAKIEAIQNEIKAEMGEEETAETNKFFIRNTEYGQRRVDSQKLKNKHPKIYLECSNFVTSHRFSYVEK